MKNLIIVIWILLFVLGCRNSTITTSTSTDENKELRNKELNDSLAQVDMKLSYKEFILGEPFSKCERNVLKNGSMRKKWDDINERYEYESELLDVNVIVTVEQFQDTIYEIKLNSSKWSNLRLDTLYKSKYGRTGYNDLPVEESKLGWGMQRDTRWVFKNSILEINRFYGSTDGDFKGAYVIYTDKKHANKRNAYVAKQEQIQDSIQKAKEAKQKEEEIKRQAKYKDDI